MKVYEIVLGYFILSFQKRNKNNETVPDLESRTNFILNYFTDSGFVVIRVNMVFSSLRRLQKMIRKTKFKPHYVITFSWRAFFECYQMAFMIDPSVSDLSYQSLSELLHLNYIPVTNIHEPVTINSLIHKISVNDMLLRILLSKLSKKEIENLKEASPFFKLQMRYL